MAIRVLPKEDLGRLISFLEMPIIDQQFIKPLSERPITISERVHAKSRRGTWIVAEDNKDIVGCRSVTYNPTLRVLGLSTFVVHPDYRGKGIGKELYRFSIEYREEGWNPIKIEVDSWEGNDAAAYLANFFGFRQVKTYLDKEKRPPGIKTVVYEKTLT